NAGTPSLPLAEVYLAWKDWVSDGSVEAPSLIRVSSFWSSATEPSSSVGHVAAAADGMRVMANVADGVSFGQGARSIVGWIVRVAGPVPSGIVRVAAPASIFVGTFFVALFVVSDAFTAVGVTWTAVASWTSYVNVAR